LVLASYWVSFKLPKKGKRISETPDKDGDYQHEKTWAYDRWGNPDAVWAVWVISAFTVVISTMIAISSFFVAIKIWIAPKLWLVEFAATLTSKGCQ